MDTLMKIWRRHYQHACYAGVVALAFHACCGFSADAPTGLAVTDFNVQDIDSLQAPTSPAFSLLGISPTAIDKPATPTALGASVLAATAQGQGSIPKNVAIQFGPYWLFDHAGLSFDDYYAVAEDYNVPKVLLQTLSVSIATGASDVTNAGGTQKGTAFALGLNMNLFQGSRSPDLDGVLQTLNNDDDTALVNRVKNGSFGQDDINKINADTGKVIALDKQRVGFGMALSSALSLRAPDTNQNYIEADRFGVWLTPYYHPSSKDSTLLSYFTALGVGRYIHDFRNRADYFDEGARLIWQSKQLPLMLSGEVLYREGSTASSSSSYGIMAQYTVNQNISLVASYGKLFKNDIPSANNIAAIFGVSVGWSKTPVSLK